MKRSYISLCLLAISALLFVACDDTAEQPQDEFEEVSQAILDQLSQAGFNTQDVFKTTWNGNEGYVVEYDLFFTEAEIAGLTNDSKVPDTEHYHTTNLVSTPRVIKVGIDPDFGSSVVTALNNTVAMYNAENLELTFQVTSVTKTVTGRGRRQTVTYNTDADILVTAFNERPRRGLITLGIAAGFPTSSGDPANGFGINTYWIDNLGASVDEITGTMAHEIGHCIGLRHTDYTTRASCPPASQGDEGAAGVGAIYIPGTPSGSDLTSLMEACGPGDSFNANDVIALNYLY